VTAGTGLARFLNAEEYGMRDNLKQMGKQLGRGILNLIAALALLFATLALTRGHVSNIVTLMLASATLLIIYIAGARWIERRRPTELMGSIGLAEFASGIGLGVVLFSVVLGLLWVAGVYHPSGRGTVAGLGIGALAALLEAIVEEILFRGFLYRLAAIVAGTWVALLFTSALFGAAHAANPGATLISSIAIALEAGVLLAAAYAVTGRLCFPIGLHAGWNFAEGSLFGMSVSGGAATTGLIAGTLKGRVILTGGAFGPEASVLAVVVCLAVALLLLWRTVRLGRVEHAVWSSGVIGAQTSLNPPLGQWERSGPGAK
jgi:uncharacterized protein